MIVLVMAVKFLEYLYLGGDAEDLMKFGIAISVVAVALIGFEYFGKKALSVGDHLNKKHTLIGQVCS